MGLLRILISKRESRRKRDKRSLTIKFGGVNNGIKLIFGLMILELKRVF